MGLLRSALPCSPGLCYHGQVRSVLVSHEGRLLQHYGDLLQTSERQQVEVREQMHKGHSVMDVYKEQWRWPTVSGMFVHSVEAAIAYVTA